MKRELTAENAPTGLVSNVTIRNAELYNVSLPIHVYQTNGAHPCVLVLPMGASAASLN